MERIVVSFIGDSPLIETTRSDVEIIRECVRIDEEFGVRRGLVSYITAGYRMIFRFPFRSILLHNRRDETPTDRRMGGSPANESVDVRAAAAYSR